MTPTSPGSSRLWPAATRGTRSAWPNPQQLSAAPAIEAHRPRPWPWARFWQDAIPTLWFARDPEFDRRFRERFAQHEGRRARGE